MPPKRNLCAECKNYDTGARDPSDNLWYCTPCWTRFNGKITTQPLLRAYPAPSRMAYHPSHVDASAAMPDTAPADYSRPLPSSSRACPITPSPDVLAKAVSTPHTTAIGETATHSPHIHSDNINTSNNNNSNNHYDGSTNNNNSNNRSHDKDRLGSVRAAPDGHEMSAPTSNERLYKGNRSHKLAMPIGSTDAVSTASNVRLQNLLSRMDMRRGRHGGESAAHRYGSSSSMDMTTASDSSVLSLITTAEAAKTMIATRAHGGPVTSLSSLLNGPSAMNGLSRHTFLASVMSPPRAVAVLAHSGEPLSPTGDRAGGVARGAHARTLPKTTLDAMLCSVDDIVSQVYIHLDDDMTKLLLNALDRVTVCETADQRDRTKLRVMDELLEVLGDARHDLLQCILYRPREVFVRLLEEFCTLSEDDEEEGGGAGEGLAGGSIRLRAGASAALPRSGAMTVQFVSSTRSAHTTSGAASGKLVSSLRGQELALCKNGELTNQRWLAHMNRRYRALMQECELDEIFKRDFSVSGSTMPSNVTMTRKETYTRVHIPATAPTMLPVEKRICVATELPEWAQPALCGITHLNTIQTTIFHTAYHTAQNMLVCAPTGAGKTVCALLVMLRCMKDHLDPNGTLDRRFKIIFVAPMKALAQEMVQNFGKRLAPFLIQVRELTGDMQLTKREMHDSQVLVTTPEKWDVITRKSSNMELMEQVKLIIMDEIHLLNEDRGPVLEAIVARTLRQNEMHTERTVRLVGLSATLPNYKDVANFLRVDLQDGLKVFGPEYRPVPLEQTFIGLHDTTKNKEQQLDQLAYEEVLANLKGGHQVMVFVHSRKQTVSLAKYFMDRARKRNEEHWFRGGDGGAASTSATAVTSAALRKGRSLQGKDLSTLFEAGLGAHHAGLIRHDRTTTEHLFHDGFIRVLCCTSTLAWGVNLPAHTVIIRGTQMYDPRRGGLVSISVLDVMQIFGRAGRPQFDTRGHGIILSDEKQVSHFLRLLAHALPIESHMHRRLCDHLNAEIHTGLISSVAEACAWLEYTYLWQRIRVNPLRYGLTIADVRRDPALQLVRCRMIHTALHDLVVAGMIRFQEELGLVESTDWGRLASHYYLTHETMTIFRDCMQRADQSWVECLDVGAAMEVAARASEFAQLRVRPEEVVPLQQLQSRLPRPVQQLSRSAEGSDETSVTYKVTTLAKAYVSRLLIEDCASLAADVYYVTQNMPRIARALFEMELERGHPLTMYAFLTLCQCLEHRCWHFEHPLRQFARAGEQHSPHRSSAMASSVWLTDSVWRLLTQRQPRLSQMQDMSAKELGAVVRNGRAGHVLADLIRHVPSFDLRVQLQPLTRTILRVQVTLAPTFVWSRDLSGAAEALWLLVVDQDHHFIFHHEAVAVRRVDVEGEGGAAALPTVTLSVPVVPQYDVYVVRLYSDRWMNCDTSYTFSLAHLHLPPDGAETATPLLALEPLSLPHVLPARYHALYQAHMRQLNAMQSQVFHTMFHTDANVLLGAPTGSGKTMAAEMAVMRVWEEDERRRARTQRNASSSSSSHVGWGGSKVVYIAPLKALVKERLRDWGTRFAALPTPRTVVELSGEATPDVRALAQADVLCTTPEKWDGVSRSWQVRRYVTQVRLVIFDEVHMLGTERGPTLEVIVSRMRWIGWTLGTTVRLIGLSTAVSNAADLASWLGVQNRSALFNFDPAVRPVPMTVHIAGYHGKHYCPRMMAMNKPVYHAIWEKSAHQPVIVFVSSRRQTRYTALALIGFLMADERTSAWVHMSAGALETALASVRDDTVKHCFQFGIGLHHAGLCEGDRAAVEKAFLSNGIQILVATSTLAWGVNFPAHMVIVKGTEYYDGKTHSYVDFPITDLLQMIGRAGRPQFDTEGVAQVLCLESKKSFYRKFLYDPFPVESALHTQLQVHLNAEVVAGTVSSVHEARDYLTWTFLYRRLSRNPSYYGLEDGSSASVTRFLTRLAMRTLIELAQYGCVTLTDAATQQPIDAGQQQQLLLLLSGEENDTHTGTGKGGAHLYDGEVAVQGTVLGRLCSYYYISHKTVHLFTERLTAYASCAELLQLLCDAEEFNELPVRHNEDKHNVEIARMLPLPIKASEAESPHVKAFVLFQAQFARTPLPMDYVTDQKSTLDNAIRVVQAMVDVAAYHGHLYTALRCMTLMQCMVQGRWWSDATLLQLPHVRPEMLAEVARACGGVREAADLANAPLQTLRDFQAVLEQPSYALSRAAVRETMRAVRGLPLIHVELCCAPNNTTTAAAAKQEPATRRASWLATVSLTRLSHMQGHVVCPYFSKPKDEQYWVVIGDEATGELLAMKRVNRLQQSVTVTLTVDDDDDEEESNNDEGEKYENSAQGGRRMGQRAGRRRLDVYVVCDSYLGMDQQYSFEWAPESST